MCALAFIIEIGSLKSHKMKSWNEMQAEMVHVAILLRTAFAVVFTSKLNSIFITLLNITSMF